MGHPNEQVLRDAYAAFGKGDLEGFLSRCDDDVTFTVPEGVPFSGTYTKETFGAWIGEVMAICGGDFSEDVVDVVANDDHGTLLLEHHVGRGGAHHDYRVNHVVEFRGGKIGRWIEWPGDQGSFSSAWS